MPGRAFFETWGLELWFLNQNNGILGFGWSHPSYGSKINNSGAWTEGNFSNLIFNISAKNIWKTRCPTD